MMVVVWGASWLRWFQCSTGNYFIDRETMKCIVNCIWLSIWTENVIIWTSVVTIETTTITTTKSSAAATAAAAAAAANLACKVRTTKYHWQYTDDVLTYNIACVDESDAPLRCGKKLKDDIDNPEYQKERESWWWRW